MANLQYSSDILDYILFKSGEKTDGTSDFDDVALEYLNTAYRKIWMGGMEFDPTINEDWTWLRDKNTLTLQTKISTGTVSVTNNSASATLSATQATDLDDWFFKVDDHEDVFRVSAHTGGSAALTLDSVYTGDTNGTANYKVVKLEYALQSDVLHVLSPMQTQRSNGKLGRIDGIALQKIPPPHLIRAGVPENFAQVDESTVRFDRYADSELVRIDYRYKKRPADLTDSGSEEPLVPLRHRHVIGNIALFDILVDKNDNRSDTVGLIAKQGLKAMALENRYRQSIKDGTFGKIYSRIEQLNRDKSFIEPYAS